MLTVAEIKDVKFSRAVGGYKAEDVDLLLDKVEADYAEFERIIREYIGRVETLNSEIETLKDSQNSVQNVLVSAQQLADRIIKEAKEKSDEIIKNAQDNIAKITAHEKELSVAFEIKAKEQKRVLEKELADEVDLAQKKADAITAAAEERVKHQQMLFDRLKLEISAFKASVTASYKEHIESLSKLPDSVPADPKYVTDIIKASYDKPIALEEKEDVENDIFYNFEEASVPPKAEPEVKKEKVTSGFVIGDIETEEEE